MPATSRPLVFPDNPDQNGKYYIMRIVDTYMVMDKVGHILGQATKRKMQIALPEHTLYLKPQPAQDRKRTNWLGAFTPFQEL